ncbi:MAG TPA: OmpA family protein [Panacibacter sp.]|nr:OmpA family protein [Panacibacter sp.]
MVSRKYFALLVLSGLIATATFAQKSDAGYGWVLDSSKRSVKNMPQQNEFMNNQYPYPSKPRSMWELGVSGGVSYIKGDVSSKLGYGGGLSFRKALSHVFSVRLGWQGAFNYGLDSRTSTGLSSAGFSGPGHNPWKDIYTSAGDKFVYNYRTQAHQLYADVITSLNAFSGYRGNPKVDYYVLAGYSYNSFDVDVNALNGNTKYNFGSINYNQSKKDVKKDLKDLLDKSYENNASFGDANTGTTSRLSGNQLLHHALDLGGGVSFRVTDRINIGVEQKFVLPFGDELDGKAAGISRDIWSTTQFRINLNMGSSSKNVLPLWWLNGNNYIYNEVNQPKHMKLPPVVLPDADGDGVTDQFDMEPNTPSGSPVDSHGVSRDTDGDGVPDARDKEPLTARDCFPVDADGIGKCPEPPCCAEIRNMRPPAPVCAIGSLPSAQFKSGSLSLTATATAILNSVAQQMNANPACNVRVNGYYDASNKRSQQLSWDRVNTVIKYLVEKQGISESRLIFNLSGGGDVNTVDMMGTTESGPNTVPAPFPNLQKSK